MVHKNSRRLGYVLKSRVNPTNGLAHLQGCALRRDVGWESGTIVRNESESNARKCAWGCCATFDPKAAIHRTEPGQDRCRRVAIDIRVQCSASRG